MATVFTHALVGASIAATLPTPVSRTRLLLCGALLAAMPDLDVVSFALGIPYGHALGHRGLTHSLLFAVLAGVGTVLLLFRDVPLRSRAGCVLALGLALATASHGVLDAFTDAGLGIGFLLPFDATRSFAPWRPLVTSPIGVEAFVSGPAFAILANEILWVWLPVAACLLAVAFARRRA